MIQSILIGLLRHALTYGGGTLVSSGLITSSDSEQAVGAILTVAGIAWSAYQKYQEQKKLKAAATTDVISIAVTQANTAARKVETHDLPPVS